MPTPAPPRRSRFAVWRWPRWVRFAVILLMLFGYPLSFGPAIYLVQKNYIPHSCGEVLNVVYTPLFVACSVTPVTHRALFAYLDWWVEWAEEE